MRFIEETNSLEKIDRLVNDHALNSESLRKRVHFGSNRPWQILTGIIVAKLVNRSNYRQLKEGYQDFAKDFKLGEVRSIDRFHKVVEYFDKQ